MLRRLAATATQVQKRTQQARSSQYYPSLAVLVADVVGASGLDQVRKYLIVCALSYNPPYKPPYE